MSKEKFQDTIETIKAIPGRKYRDGIWTIPVEYATTLRDALKCRINWNPKLQEIVKDYSVSDSIKLDSLKLKPYSFQLLGIAFLIHIKKCMLADEMGLGKTIQAIGAIHSLWEQGKVRKALVICPASLKYQWANEIEKFTNHKTLVIDGNAKHRAEQYSQEPSLFTIINYELARQKWDISKLKELKPDVLVLDEGHRIKNWDSETSKNIKTLDAKYKWVLTGTPMQNKLEELYNLFNFIDPDILGNWTSFRNRHLIIRYKFGRPMVVGYSRIPEIREKITPYMLRRLKSEVAPELPSLVINNYSIPMTPEQIELHDKVRLNIREILDEIRVHKGDEPHPKENQLLGLFTLLAEISDSPQLLSMSDSKMASRFKTKSTKSPKLDELYIILENNIKEDPESKTIIFTQFERMQRIIVKRLSKLGKCVILNGSMASYERQAAMDKFKYNKDVKFFISTDAGNYGLNLEIATTVINFDLPWNPAVWEQRCARAHRITSTNTVYVINLVSQDGIDERILKVMYDKLELSNQLIEKTTHPSKLTLKVLDKLTKQGGKAN